MSWKILRMQILERDKYTCQYCKHKPRYPHIHHIIPKIYGGIDSLDNLITLCSSCHITEDYKIKAHFDIKRRSHTSCNKCESNNIIKAGLKHYSLGMRQRYYCKNCLKFFNGGYV